MIGVKIDTNKTTTKVMWTLFGLGRMLYLFEHSSHRVFFGKATYAHWKNIVSSAIFFPVFIYKQELLLAIAGREFNV